MRSRALGQEVIESDDGDRGEQGFEHGVVRGIHGRPGWIQGVTRQTTELRQ